MLWHRRGCQGRAEQRRRIVTIVARRARTPSDVALHFAVLAMLLVPTVGALVPQAWIDLGDRPLFG